MRSLCDCDDTKPVMSVVSSNIVLKWLAIIAIAALLLYFGAVLFIPMLFGLLIAFVMYPLCLMMEKKGLGRSVAITLCLLIVATLLGALVSLLGWQIELLRNDLPALMKKLAPALTELQRKFGDTFSISAEMQEEWVRNAILNSGDKIGALLNSAFNATLGTVFVLFLVPIYTALFLYHREVFLKALEYAFGLSNKLKVQSILHRTIYTYSSYIKGMVIVYILVGILNSIGLLVLGIEHAVLFGMLTAIMTIIPYVGIMVSALLPITMAYITKDSIWYSLGVVGVFTFVQYLEANVIFPTVVGKQLNVSTWATLVAIVAGGIIWGVSGMILFIPFVAILKIVAEYVPEWRALHVLLSRDHAAFQPEISNRHGQESSMVRPAKNSGVETTN